MTHEATNIDDVDLFGTLRRHMMGLTRLCLAKIRTMTHPKLNSPDVSPKRTKELRSGLTRIAFKN